MVGTHVFGPKINWLREARVDVSQGDWRCPCPVTLVGANPGLIVALSSPAADTPEHYPRFERPAADIYTSPES
jgi:hypothetical protein